MFIKNTVARLFATLAVSLYASVASAAFTGGSIVLVDGVSTITGGLNSGAGFAAVSQTVIITNLDDQGTPRLASASGGTVDFGVADFFGSASDFAFSFSSPFLDFSVDDPAGTLLMSSTQLSGDIVELRLVDLVNIEPVSSSAFNGAVDYAGLANLTINGLEQTEVFWRYSISSDIAGGAGTIAVTIDAAGQQSSIYLGIVGGATAVPVPGAVWLFASALVGLFGFSRKKVN